MTEKNLKNEIKVECHWRGSVFYVDLKLFLNSMMLQEKVPYRFVRAETGCRMFDMCQNTFERIAREAGAVHKTRGTKLIDVFEVSRYIESLGPIG